MHKAIILFDAYKKREKQIHFYLIRSPVCWKELCFVQNKKKYIKVRVKNSPLLSRSKDSLNIEITDYYSFETYEEFKVSNA